MGHRYFWQEEGKIAIWSTNVDEFVQYNLDFDDFMHREIFDKVERLSFEVLMRATNPPNIHKMDDYYKGKFDKLMKEDSGTAMGEDPRELAHKFIDKAFDMVDKLMKLERAKTRPYFDRDVISKMLDDYMGSEFHG